MNYKVTHNPQLLKWAIRVRLILFRIQVDLKRVSFCFVEPWFEFFVLVKDHYI